MAMENTNRKSTEHCPLCSSTMRAVHNELYVAEVLVMCLHEWHGERDTYTVTIERKIQYEACPSCKSSFRNVGYIGKRPSHIACTDNWHNVTVW